MWSQTNHFQYQGHPSLDLLEKVVLAADILGMKTVAMLDVGAVAQRTANIGSSRQHTRSCCKCDRRIPPPPRSRGATPRRWRSTHNGSERPQISASPVQSPSICQGEPKIMRLTTIF
ncbi:hypothetical protein E2C01_000913 [Portunus trituberculatus]|uniref:Uncharacterized protein n=1 Tax=Portunus trituberculatus TaxID=210409 RepID=A0A5B7CFD2_PORTR|nr:hypothetical protein [Portunus trituberculatus]